MPYPEFFVAPMREDLTILGVEELRTPADVDTAVTGAKGTLMVVVNSVCGCAAGKARPGLALALRNGVPRRQARLHAGAQPDREPGRAGHRVRAQGRVREVLRADAPVASAFRRT